MSYSSRDADILERHNRREPQAEIARQYGITRERVRQIVKKMGGQASLERLSIDHDQIAAVVAAENLTHKAATERFGRDVYYAVRARGVNFGHEPHLYEAPEILALVERVRDGESIHAVSGGVRRIEGQVLYLCNKLGVVSLHGRHRSFDARRQLVQDGRIAGKSWKQIAADVSAVEGVTVDGAAVYAWATRNMDTPPRGKSTRTARRIEREPRFVPEVIRCTDIKEAARLNYGKAPASLVGAAHGVSRNVIIGHWFRLRRAGAIA